MALHVITGASAGMGRATVAALTARGHDVVAVARSTDRLRELATETGATAVSADVGTAEGRAAVIETVAARGRPVASVVHGAATEVAMEPWLDLDADMLTAHFAVHVAAPVALTAALHRGATVERCVIFDSYSASTPRVGWAAYSILKAAAQMAFRAAADELPDVAVARVFPGAVDTPLLERVLAADRSIEATEVYHELLARGRVSSADDIAVAVAGLLELDLAEFAAQPVWSVGHSADLD